MPRIPFIRSWIERTVADHAQAARPVSAIIEAQGFHRLPGYFDADFLRRIRCAAVERVPVPAVASMGLGFLVRIEPRRWAGITLGETYFVDRRHEQVESLHFHELIHAVQWQCLGFDPFIRAYAAGLLRHGYARSPLEVMARAHQRRFETDPAPYPADVLVREELSARFTQRRR